jgi:DNA-binding MarR family transcriptional regulator
VSTPRDRAELMKRIVDLQAHVTELMEADRTRAWLDVDLTIQQLKVVFLAVRMGSLTAGQIGRELRVGFSTVTGLIDRLADQGLVSRGEDPNDRRATRVVPTAAARAVVERLYSYRRSEFLRLLEHVPTETLVALADGLSGLEDAARKLHAERPGSADVQRGVRESVGDRT